MSIGIAEGNTNRTKCWKGIGKSAQPGSQEGMILNNLQGATPDFKTRIKIDRVIYEFAEG